MRPTWPTKKSKKSKPKSRRCDAVTKKLKERKTLEEIPGTEYLSEQQKKHVRVHTKSARTNVSGKRIRKVMKRLRHNNKMDNKQNITDVDDAEMVDMSQRKERKSKTKKSRAMDVDES